MCSGRLQRDAFRDARGSGTRRACMRRVTSSHESLRFYVALLRSVRASGSLIALRRTFFEALPFCDHRWRQLELRQPAK